MRLKFEEEKWGIEYVACGDYDFWPLENYFKQDGVIDEQFYNDCGLICQSLMIRLFEDKKFSPEIKKYFITKMLNGMGYRAIIE